MPLKKILHLGRGVRVQFERVTQNYVLLFPEGCVDLNESAKEVLTSLPMARSQIRSTLNAKYGSTEGLDEFIDHALVMKWLEPK